AVLVKFRVDENGMSDTSLFPHGNGTSDASSNRGYHMNIEGFVEQLRDWHEKIGVYQGLLSREARRLRWRHYRFGLLATLLPLVAGSTIFLSLALRPDARTVIASTAGLLACAALTSMMTFYNHARCSEHSRF